jgi:hypothetical protein
MRGDIQLLQELIARGSKVAERLSAAVGPEFELTPVMREVPSE